MRRQIARWLAAALMLLPLITVVGIGDAEAGTTLTGTVKSIGWGIAQQDGSTSHDLLPAINPNFEWIRLAQRIPVRIELDPLPDHVELRVGTTAAVLVQTGN